MSSVNPCPESESTSFCGFFDLDDAVQALRRWTEAELPRHWGGLPSWTWDLEIWNRAPEVSQGGEALLAWGGLGDEVMAG